MTDPEASFNTHRLTRPDKGVDIENSIVSVESLLDKHIDDLSQYRTENFDVKFVSVVDEKAFAQQISERIPFGFHTHLSTDHPFYSLPKPIPPSKSEFLYDKSELYSAPQTQRASGLPSLGPTMSYNSVELPAGDHRPLISVLHAPPPAEPPVKGFYPLAPASGFELVADARYKRGYVYVASYNISEQKAIDVTRLAGIVTPPNIDLQFVDGAFKSLQIPGMIQMRAGIPFAFAFDGDPNRLHTVGCLQTLDSLRGYPDFPDILTLSVKLSKLTWGCKAHNNTLQINPIYELPGMKENDRSTKRTAWHEHPHDGSFNLANTVMKGDGQGTFLPAVQANSSSAATQISTVLHVLHALYQHIMPKCISKFEYSVTAFHADYNNILCFGGPGMNGTSIQMNSSSLGDTLASYIGNVQGGWHTDVHDDMCTWTLFYLLLRVGPEGDPGPFCLARSGLYIRETNQWIVFLAFKGTDLHSGFVPQEDSDAHQKWINENLASAWELAGPQNRVGYVNYISTIPSHRTGSTNISPPTLFGNYGSSQIHKVRQKNFALHGHASLGGRDNHANRLGREIIFDLWNSLQLAGLDLDMNINNLLTKISYKNLESSSSIPLKPISDSFNPQSHPETIRRYLGLYEWHRREALLFHIRLPSAKSQSTTADSSSITLSDKAGLIAALGQVPPLNAEPPAQEAAERVGDDQYSEASNTSLKILEVLDVIKATSGKSFYKVILEGEVEPILISVDSPRLKGNKTVIDWMEKKLPSDQALIINSAVQSNAQSSNVPVQNDSSTQAITMPLPEKCPIKSLPTCSRKRKNLNVDSFTNSDEDLEIENDRYEVEEIIDHRKEDGIWEWHVRWKGYDEETWMESGQLGDCIELLHEYTSSHGIDTNEILGFTTPAPLNRPLGIQAGKAPRRKRTKLIPSDSETVTLTVSNLDILKKLLSPEDLESELRQLETDYHSPKAKEAIRVTDLRSKLELWGNQLYRNSFLRRTLTLLSPNSPRSAGLEFQLLQNSVDILTPLAATIEQMNIVRRSFRVEMCCSLVQVFNWYTHSGPRVAELLVTLHSTQGYPALKQHLPQFADLVDHVMQYVYHSIVSKFASVDGKATQIKHPRTRYSPEQLHLPNWGLVLDKNTIALIPSHLYGTQHSTSQKEVKVKLPPLKNIQIQHTYKSLYSASASCLLELWSREIIIPKIQGMDKIHSISNTTDFDFASILHRSLTCGAILSCIADACGTTGIFALSQIDVFLRHPAVIFKSSHRQFAPEVIKKRDAILKPLFEWIKSYLVEHPELSSNANRLGELAQLRTLELLVGPVPSTKGVLSESSRPADDVSETILTLQPVIFDNLIPQEGTQKIHIGVLGLILREALNHSRHLAIGDELLHRVLIGEHATRGASGPRRCNPDHTNPICQTLEGVSLLQTHLPAKKLTSKVGLSNLLSWMGTGQGHKTTQFLNSIDCPGGFFSSTLQEVINIFQVMVDHNAKIISENPGHPKPQNIPGIVAVDDMLVWGQPNNLLSSMPTADRVGNRIIKLSLFDKFSPYWTEVVQTGWMTFLDGLLDKDPLEYTGPRKTWTQGIAFLNKLGIDGFRSGLTPFQLINHLVAFKIVDLPTPTDMALWISRHHKLGAYRGLTSLGFNIIPTNPTSVCCAFTCIHSHLNEHLTKEDKDVLFFTPILTEHILCKIPRWTSHLQAENASGRLEKLAAEAELEPANCQQWVSGANLEDYKAFPFPLVISKIWLKKVVDEVNFSIGSSAVI